MTTERDTVLDVQGMTCSSCIRHVRSALGALDGVATVQVEIGAGTVAVRHDPAAAPIDRIVDALEEAGYPARPRGV